MVYVKKRLKCSLAITCTKTDADQSETLLLEGTENEDSRYLTRDKFRVDTFTVILDSLSTELLNAESKLMQSLMKGFKFSSDCDGSPLTRFIVLQRIFKTPTLWTWKNISLMKNGSFLWLWSPEPNAWKRFHTKSFCCISESQILLTHTQRRNSAKAIAYFSSPEH